MALLVRTIVIVGGGFSGTMVAANLLRQAPSGPTRIILIERAHEIGRGVAYAQRRHPYLLNVPASRMSATPNAVNEFVQFAQRRVPHVTAEDFLPRALYGDYLQEVLLAAELSAPRNVRLDKWQGSVTNVRRLERHMPLQVELADGRRLTSDDVVLALGNPAPAPLGAARDIESHRAYVADPYTARPHLLSNRERAVDRYRPDCN